MQELRSFQSVKRKDVGVSRKDDVARLTDEVVKMSVEKTVAKIEQEAKQRAAARRAVKAVQLARARKAREAQATRPMPPGVIPTSTLQRQARLSRTISDRGKAHRNGHGGRQ